MVKMLCVALSDETYRRAADVANVKIDRLIPSEDEEFKEARAQVDAVLIHAVKLGLKHLAQIGANAKSGDDGWKPSSADYVHPADDEIVKEAVDLAVPPETETGPYEYALSMGVEGCNDLVNITRGEYAILTAVVAALRGQAVSSKVDEEWMNTTPDCCSFGVSAYDRPDLSGATEQEMELSLDEYERVKCFILGLRLAAAYNLVAEAKRAA